MKKAVLWDFGGVILSSPFEAFNRYEATHGLPADFIRSVNATNPHDNAWAKLERGEIDAIEFDEQFNSEAMALGHRVPGGDILALLSGEIRPEMVALLDRVKTAGYKVACLTNNVVGSESAVGHSRERAAALAAVMARFDEIVESSKVGVRKPERRFYEIACERLGVTPDECIFLDDLGINLKPAAQMGMTTIKVTSDQQAIDELNAILWPK